MTRGEYIHANVCAPFKENSIGGSRYFLCFKDDYTKFRRVLFLKYKSEVVKCLPVFLNEEKQQGILSKSCFVMVKANSSMQKFGNCLRKMM